MGAGQSQASDRQPSRGLHILRVTPASPASQTDLEPFFDFVVGLEDNPFSSDIDASELERIVESNEDKQLNLLVWSSKTQQTRREHVFPPSCVAPSMLTLLEASRPGHTLAAVVLPRQQRRVVQPAVPSRAEHAPLRARAGARHCLARPRRPRGQPS